MAKKRKMSTFERLQGGKLNRTQRKELQQRLQAADPGLTVVHPDAAGIDVGNASHFVAVPAGRDPYPVREFGSWTADLHRMAEWLKCCGIGTVAIQSTGVYWIALQEILEEHGIEVYLVNARGTRNLPGRKSDVQECQWLMKLHTYGLLRNSFRPPEEIRAVRTVWRLYGGWWDGNPATLKPAPERVLAAELASLAGGAGVLAARAVELAESVPGGAAVPGDGSAGSGPRVADLRGGDERLRLAGHLAELAWQAAPADAAVREARHRVFTIRAEQATSTMASGVYRWAASETAGE